MKIVYKKDYGEKICLIIETTEGSVSKDKAILENQCDNMKEASDRMKANIVIGGEDELGRLIAVVALVRKDYEPEPEDENDPKEVILMKALEVVKKDVQA